MLSFRNIIKIVLAVLLVVGFLFLPVRALTISNGNEIAYAFFLRNDSFSVHWIHSVEKEEWVEYFTVQDQKIILDSTKFKTFGAGVPSWSEEPTVLKDGWVYMDFDREIGEKLVVRTTSINNYRVEYNSKMYALKPSDSAYKIEAKKTPLVHVVRTFFKEIVR